MAEQTTAQGQLNVQSLEYDGLTWVNIVSPSRAEMNFLREHYPFHPLELEDCLSKRQLSKIDKHEEYLFVLLHFPRFLKAKRVTRASQVSIFLGKDYLVTVHDGDLKPLMEIYESCLRDEQQRQEILGGDSGSLFHRILDRLVDYLFPILDKVLESLDEIEDRVFDEKIEPVREVTILRRDIADQRRIIFPLRRIIRELAISAQPFTKKDLTVYFSDISDHINRAWETLEECKETIEIYKDTDYMLNTEKTNKILAILTLVFTLSIPATIIGTLYGMNVNLPGGIEIGPWTFLGRYTTFFLVLFLAIVPAALMAWFFRRMRWM